MKLRNFINSFVKSFLLMSTLSVSAYAGADCYNHLDNNYFDVNHCHTNCLPPPGVANDCCGTPCNAAPECGWAYNPPAYPRCGCDTFCCDSTMTFRADFLWWRASQEGLQLGTEEFLEEFENSGTPERTTVINRSHSKKPDFKYDPGFRIGLSNYCPCDCWDFAVNWTHFHTKAHARGATSEADDITFISDWERVIGANPLLSRGRYSLNLDYVDIEFGRKFYASNCFVLRPEFGLRVARINQHYRIDSVSSSESDDPFSSFTSQVKARSNFLSVGPRVGLDVELQLGCGITLFGQAAGSILFGKFDNHSRELFQDFTPSEGSEIGTYSYNAKSSAHRCSRTVSDLAFGFKWDRCYEWCGRSHPISLAFAWEHHAFYDLNNFNFASRGFDEDLGVISNGVAKRGDLYTQGLTVSLSFGF